MNTTRRTLVRGAAWTSPVIALAATAPAVAASPPIKVPGINGCVLNTPTSLSGSCRWSLHVNGRSDQGSYQGASYGLYVYDVNTTDVMTNAYLIYWIIGTQTGVSWSRNSGSGWGTPTSIGTAVKDDGLTYTGYRSEYTPAIIPAGGGGTVFLTDFDWTATFTQNSTYCSNVTYWTERHITINGADQTFERRIGTNGPFTGAKGLMSQKRAGSRPAAS